MIAYLAELQRVVETPTHYEHLGWTNDYSAFVLPDKILRKGKCDLPATLHRNAARMAAQIHKRGRREKQKQLLYFFSDPAYIPQQFVILASLAAPLFYMTGQYGAVVCANGESGASKSLALFTAASLWGNPELYALGGANPSATLLFRFEHFDTLGSLPIVIEDVTNMQTARLVDVIMLATQPGFQCRLDGEKPVTFDERKTSLVMTSAAEELYKLLARDNTAAGISSVAMRIVEVPFRQTTVHDKRDAEMFFACLKENYGYIGENFMRHVIAHRVDIERRVREKIDRIDAAANIRPNERIWSATIAATLVAGEVAREFRLAPFAVEAIEQWALRREIPYLRRALPIEADPLQVLFEFVEQYRARILVTKNRFTVHRLDSPTLGKFGQYDMRSGALWIRADAFAEHCRRKGGNSDRIIGALAKSYRGLVTERTAQKVVGANTRYSDLKRNTVHVFHMKHEALADLAADLARLDEQGESPCDESDCAE